MGCPVPGMERLHETMKDAPRLASAVSNGILTFIFYATPDFIRRRSARIAAKTAVVAAVTGVVVHDGLTREDANMPELDTDLDTMESENFAGTDTDGIAGTDTDDRETLKLPESKRARAAFLLGGSVLLAGMIALDVAAERWIFRRGERRRAAGKRLPHTRQALWLAALVSTGEYLIDRSEELIRR